MASAAEKTTVSSSCCVNRDLRSSSSSISRAETAAAASAPVSTVVSAAIAEQDWSVVSTDRRNDQLGKKVAMASMIRAVDSLPEPSANASSKGSPLCLCLFFLYISRHMYECVFSSIFVIFLYGMDDLGGSCPIFSFFVVHCRSRDS